MKMHNLKTTVAELKEKKKEMQPSDMPMDMDEYPYGTRISFTENCLDKIPGLEKLDVGDEIEIRAKAKIVMRESTERAKGDNHERIELQITDFGFADKGNFDDAFDEAQNGSSKRKK